MNINGLLREINKVKLSEFVCITKVQTESDAEALREDGYDVGFTLSEWEAKYTLPADKIFYAKSPYSSMYYVDMDNPPYPIVVSLNIYGNQRLAMPAGEDDETFCQRILKHCDYYKNLHGDKLTLYISNLGGYLATDVLREYVNRNEPSEEMFTTFFSVYEEVDFGGAWFSKEEMEKVLKGMGAATQRKFRKLLHKLPDEVTIYRGEAEASAPYTKAFSWTTDIRVAYFFACRQSDGYARVVSAKVKKQDILFMLDRRNEKEVLVFPEGIYGIDTSSYVQIPPDEALSVLTDDDLDCFYWWRETVNLLYRYEAVPQDHSVLHSIRVLLLALLIIENEELVLKEDDVAQLMQAITFHDIGRQNGDEDPKHGEYSTAIYKENHSDPVVEFLIQYHCVDDKKAKKALDSDTRIKDKQKVSLLYNVLKDADALDRVRFGLRDLDVRYLRIPISKQLVLTADQCLRQIRNGE